MAEIRSKLYGKWRLLRIFLIKTIKISNDNYEKIKVKLENMRGNDR